MAKDKVNSLELNNGNINWISEIRSNHYGEIGVLTLTKMSGSQLQQVFIDLLSPSPIIVESLSIVNCDYRGMEGIDKVLISSGVKFLKIQDTIFTNDDIKNLSSGLCDNSSLQTLTITGAALGQISNFSVLTNALKNCSSLKLLDLSSNQINADGSYIENIADLCKSNKVINQLILDDNCVGNKGAIQLATLSSLCNLKLTLGNNDQDPIKVAQYIIYLKTDGKIFSTEEKYTALEVSEFKNSLLNCSTLIDTTKFAQFIAILERDFTLPLSSEVESSQVKDSPKAELSEGYLVIDALNEEQQHEPVKITGELSQQ